MVFKIKELRTGYADQKIRREGVRDEGKLNSIP